MKALCFGSLNIDYIYNVDAFVTAEETVHSKGFAKVCGGKGLNQSIALSKTGIRTYIAGSVSSSGEMLTKYCRKFGVDTTFVNERSPVETGHAIIQVDASGQNCILLYGGANQSIDTSQVDAVLMHFGKGDYIILQNEISNIGYIMRRAYEKGLVIVFNPSPINGSIKTYPLELVNIFIMNRVEGTALSGCGSEDYETMVTAISEQFPGSRILLTLGNRGSIYKYKDLIWKQGIFDIPVVDSTGAGDTFTGYFISRIMSGECIRSAMETAAKASAIAVSRKGASESIPYLEEVLYSCL